MSRMKFPDSIILNDVLIEVENSTSQIDHIVISKYGIFVIETKNYHGKIVAYKNNSKWDHYIGYETKKLYHFYNPFMQNEIHIENLKKLLQIDETYFYNFVIFVDVEDLKTDDNHIVELKDFVNYNFDFLHSVFSRENIKEIYKIIDSYSLKEDIDKEAHASRLKMKEINEKNNRCKNCGRSLINGKCYYCYKSKYK